MAQVVWLKRDLRSDDHAALASAARAGPVVFLYVYEPDVYAAPEHDPSHLAFVDDSLAELDVVLQAYGGRVTYRHGTMPDVANAKARMYEIRRRTSARSEAASVYEKHGSRKPTPKRRK
jgi:deoxyribodipyrimidine photo-lyase